MQEKENEQLVRDLNATAAKLAAMQRLNDVRKTTSANGGSKSSEPQLAVVSGKLEMALGELSQSRRISSQRQSQIDTLEEDLREYARPVAFRGA